ncbi:MAG: choice-of-anchor Q domain-containing protein, partial [Planctomycetota bacterium]
VYSADKWNQPHYNNIYYVVDGKQDDPCGIPLGKGDIIADPLFVDLENRDLHLRAGSPAVDAGVDVGRTLDFENIAVLQREKPDIGAFEFKKY